ncbi:hypothetical protein DSECCO2_466710 [anaerobic digester metagenome]
MENPEDFPEFNLSTEFSIAASGNLFGTTCSFRVSLRPFFMVHPVAPRITDIAFHNTSIQGGRKDPPGGG